MLKLIPSLKNYLWGGSRLKTVYGRAFDGKLAESWEVSVHPDGLTKTENGTLKEYIEKNPTAISANGGDLPVLIKYIDAEDSLSVQVHPDDDYARRIENDNGKTEMWYIIDATEGAGIYCGFKTDTSKEELLTQINNGTAETNLNFIPVKKGDCFLIKAGTVHAINKGCMILEVQQSSNVTYRIYDYNRRGADGKLRPLHVDKAVDVINFKKFVDETATLAYAEGSFGKIKQLTSCKYFTCRELLLNGEFTEKNERSYTAVNIVSGSGTISGVLYNAGDSFFIPRGESFTISGNATVVLTTS